MIEELKISQLTLLDKNPRRIKAEQMAKLVQSLQEDPDFLQKRPILVNQTDGKNIVYAGNQRVRAAKKLNWKTVPCIIDVNLDPQVMKSRVIRDNKSLGEFDFDILANEYELPELVLWGFTPEELSGCATKILDDKEEKKGNDKKMKICPHCGEEI